MIGILDKPLYYFVFFVAKKQKRPVRESLFGFRLGRIGYIFANNWVFFV